MTPQPAVPLQPLGALQERPHPPPAPPAPPAPAPRPAVPEVLPIPSHFDCTCLGACTMTGVREANPDFQNQDTGLVLPLGSNRLMVAVFDGHGQHGREASHRARDAFARAALRRARLLCTDPLPEEAQQRLLKDMFAAADQGLREAPGEDRRGRPISAYSGTTATCALIDLAQRSVAVAHVGDSACLLADADRGVVFRTADHHIDEIAEEHILSRGGEVRTACIRGITAKRVFRKGDSVPGLMLSRALGDFVARELGVISVPEVKTGLAFSPGSVLIVASDGVWDHLAEDAALECVGVRGDSREAAKRIVERARADYGAAPDVDDITAVVVAANAQAEDDCDSDEKVVVPATRRYGCMPRLFSLRSLCARFQLRSGGAG